MKITLEPTAQGATGAHPNPTVIIDIRSDNLTISQAIDDLIRPALIAWGYSPTTVSEYLPEE